MPGMTWVTSGCMVILPDYSFVGSYNRCPGARHQATKKEADNYGELVTRFRSRAEAGAAGWKLFKTNPEGPFWVCPDCQNELALKAPVLDACVKTVIRKIGANIDRAFIAGHDKTKGEPNDK